MPRSIVRADVRIERQWQHRTGDTQPIALDNGCAVVKRGAFTEYALDELLRLPRGEDEYLSGEDQV